MPRGSALTGTSASHPPGVPGTGYHRAESMSPAPATRRCASATRRPPSSSRPPTLLSFGVAAERLGLDSVAVSDHFQPFRHVGGHSPASLPWLGALAASTSRILVGTSVLTPTYRYHPAVVAQAFATLGCLAPGRIFLGLGSGEAMNEVAPTGVEWPGAGERLERLREAVALIRQLWTRRAACTSRASWYRTRRRDDLRQAAGQPIPIWIAAGGPKGARFAGAQGGLITTSGKPRELYAERLLPNAAAGAGRGRRRSRRHRAHDRDQALVREPTARRPSRDCRFWAPLALPAEAKQGVDDPRSSSAWRTSSTTSRRPRASSAPAIPTRPSSASRPTSSSASATSSSTARRTTSAASSSASPPRSPRACARSRRPPIQGCPG